MPFYDCSEIAVMPKTKKNKIRDQKSLFANFIFLKVVASNIREAFGANNFTS